MEEIWKFYKETYNRRYGKRVNEVSNFGRVKLNGKLFNCPICPDGYYYLCHRPLHRIVAELFIPNPENKPEIDHIDTNRLNNRIDNLRWVTHKENMNNSITKDRQSKVLLGNSRRLGKKNTEETKEKIRVTQKEKSIYKNKHWKVENGKRVWIL